MQATVSLVALFAIACDPSATSDVALPATSTHSTALGAGPGAFLPSVCLGEDDLRTWQRSPKWLGRGAFADNFPTRVAGEASRGSQCEWSVVVRDGIPFVSADRPAFHVLPLGFSPRDTSEKPSVGWKGSTAVLVGFDGGEWGGSLRSYSENGALQTVPLEDNVVAILPLREESVVLTYAGHGMHPRAVLVRERDGRFQVGKTAELPVAPGAGVVESNETVLIATGRGLLRLTRDLDVTHVLDAEWWMMNPNSIAVWERQTVYIGMRGVVLEVLLPTTPPRQTWLYPF